MGVGGRAGVARACVDWGEESCFVDARCRRQCATHRTAPNPPTPLVQQQQPNNTATATSSTSRRRSRKSGAGARAARRRASCARRSSACARRSPTARTRSCSSLSPSSSLKSGSRSSPRSRRFSGQVCCLCVLLCVVCVCVVRVLCCGARARFLSSSRVRCFHASRTHAHPSKPNKGITAKLVKTEAGVDAYLISDGSGVGRGGDAKKDVLPPLMPGLKPRQQ